MQSESRIEELESIRGLAALLIVSVHTPRWNPIFELGLIRNGYLMVDLFFVLSGFVIFNAYASKISTPRQLVRFQFLRLARLYPVHLLFLGSFIAIELAKYVGQARFGLHSPNLQSFADNSVTAFVQQLLLVQAIGPTGNGTTFNGPAWSISVEFYTYLLFGGVTLLAGRWKYHLYAALFVVSTGLLLSRHTYGFEWLIECFAGFFLGCLVALLSNSVRISLPAYAPALVLAAILAFLGCKPVLEYDLAIFPLTALLILTLVAARPGPVKRLLNMKLFTWLGAISYSVYMSHSALAWIANQAVRILLKKPEALIDGRSTPALTLPETALAYGVFIGLVLLVSSLVYTFLEKPLRDRSRRMTFSGPRQAALPMDKATPLA